MKMPQRLGTATRGTQLLLLMMVTIVGKCSADDVLLPSSELAADTNRTSRQILKSKLRDCSDLPSGSRSGVHKIMKDLGTPVSAYCDMDDGEGWTVFQRRADILPRQDFFLDWESYKWGLGSLDGEFWWGLHYLWQLTSQLDRIYELRVDLWDWEEQTRYATYQHFTIASEEDEYRLNLVNYTGDAGDALTYHSGMKFSTFDRDNDNSSFRDCASEYTGAWWYKYCFRCNLNGVYSPEAQSGTAVTWDSWKYQYSLNATTMKVRPTMKF